MHYYEYMCSSAYSCPYMEPGLLLGLEILNSATLRSKVSAKALNMFSYYQETQSCLLQDVSSTVGSLLLLSIVAEHKGNLEGCMQLTRLNLKPLLYTHILYKPLSIATEG